MEVTPELSVLIPVYNEEAILSSSVVELCEKLADIAPRFEIVLAENGSRDRTREIARELARRHPQVRCLTIDEPNYGRALRAAILAARGEFVICEEIDLCDAEFHRRALALLKANETDLVVGSKVMTGAEDRRPLLRRWATLVISWLLRIAVGFRGTDTHGLKAFRRVTLLGTAQQCIIEKDLFASEFVIRAQRGGKHIVEIPLRVQEKRPPSIQLFRRVPRVLKDLLRLTWAIRFHP